MNPVSTSDQIKQDLARPSELKERLILTFKAGPDDIRSQVYSKTLEFIAEKLPGALVHNFKDNAALLKLISRHRFSTVIYTGDIAYETALFFKGLSLVQILIGMREDLVDMADVIIDPLILKSERHLVGPKYLLSSILDDIPCGALSREMGMDDKGLKEEVSHNYAREELINITQLYRKLEWDSEFFDLNVGYISCSRLTPNIERHIKKFIRKERIGLLEYRCNCHDRESVLTSSENGYLFVDMRLTFEQTLNGREAAGRPGYSIRKGTPGDIDTLKEISRGIYKYSRYYFDTNFDRQKVVEFYQNWVEKAVRGQFDDFAYVLCHDGKPVGFCTIKQTRKHAGRIGLFGISPEYKGEGLAGYLLDASLADLLKNMGISYIEVVTQGRNYAAQRLYQRSGFVTKSTELWYHKWFY